MLITDRPSADLSALRSRLHGEVHGPTDPGYEDLRKPWNRAVDQRPAAVVFPRTDEDVVTLVQFAGESGFDLAPQATGHGAGATGSLERTILVRTDHMRGVRIDPATRTARVRAGARWSDVTVPAARYGLAPLAGSSPDVGVVGYTLGGGVGWLARKHGFACNAVTAIEVVTADAQLIRTDTRTHPELFWALRGGGTPAYGIVTAIEFELHPVTALHGGALVFPGVRAQEVFTAWRDWTRTVGDEVTSLCRLINPPGGDPVAIVEVAILGGDAILAPLRALGPVADLVAPMPPDALGAIHNDPKEPSAAAHGHRLLNDLTDGAIAGLLAHAGAPLLAVELRHLGGAMARGSVCNGALNDVKGEFLMFSVGLAPDAETAMTVDAALARLDDALEPWDAGRALVNFTERPARFHDGFTQHRLRALKAQVDGAGIFRSR
ncbi:FAD-binding oxidoreductase [Solirubrobacter sp. CPCC 204708]|uniref:FAD-binding oxidoreductase n=1 Tax=Solirubrobacter deserti TaxID=2282478 RepID=A0ABT4RUE9_9ACTN|nr:FAD-binding oxidoreductase [Solirubrobacter deserti]MBE2319185.1 FAD-binding oxidoreductase [Solirubrobacter deserti]MDA0142211.1 FAD-binding oxidoreductase [Solirubrobacter deserti]